MNSVTHFLLRQSLAQLGRWNDRLLSSKRMKIIECDTVSTQHKFGSRCVLFHLMVVWFTVGSGIVQLFHPCDLKSHGENIL